MTQRLKTIYLTNVAPNLQNELKCKNVHEIPKLKKIVITGEKILTSDLGLSDLGGEVSLGALVGLEERLALQKLLVLLAHLALQLGEQLHQLGADLHQALNLHSLRRNRDGFAKQEDKNYTLEPSK